MSTMTERVVTADGRYVNVHSGLCERCSSSAAQAAIYWTDDAEFDGDAAWPPEARFTMLQQRLTEARAECVERCGRDAS